MFSDIRKNDLKNRIRVLGVFKGVLTGMYDIIARHTGNDKWEKYVHKTYMKFLEKKYWKTEHYKSSVIDEICFGKLEESDKHNIWIFWYQGFENAPQIVKDCRVNTEKYLDREKYNIHYLTKDNYTSFVKFPDWVLEKVNSGIFTLTEFSNLLREALLYRFGGIWIDSTIFITEPLDEKIIDYNYYTIRRLPNHPMFCISRHQWSTFFLATNQKETLFYKELLSINLEYWRRENGIFDYLLFDYIIALILKHNPDIDKDWDMIPYNNLDALYIEHCLNEKFDSDKWEEIKKENKIFKVTYKIKLDDDLNTNYNKIVNSLNKVN